MANYSLERSNGGKMMKNKLTDNQLIMKALRYILDDLNQLKKSSAIAYPDMDSYKELKEDLYNRIYSKEKNHE